MKEAKYYEQNDDYVICRLCPHHCHLKDQQIGKCQARENQGQCLYSLNYGKVTAIQIDPIEKKPLYHFMPGTRTLSLGSFGCNLSCVFCQNHHIAHAKKLARFEADRVETMSPEQVVTIAKEYQTPSISYTYNEPTIFYEFVYDTAKIAKEALLRNVVVTNGYIELQPLQDLLPYIDAMNIDLKSFQNDCYGSFMGGRLEPVKKAITLASQQCHVEVTTLVVTNMNDRLEEIESIAEWLATIDPEIPLHITRYFPQFNYNEPPTDLGLMYQAEKVARKYLNNVYLGNM